MEEGRISQEEFQRVIDICHEKLTLNHKDPEVWTRKGMALMGLNHHDEAADCFIEALKIDPEYDWAITNLPMALFSAGKYQESLKAFDFALKLNPDDEVLLNNKAFLLSAIGNYSEALLLIDELLQVKEDELHLLKEKVHCLNKLGKYKEALLVIDGIMGEKNHDLLSIKGQILFNLGRYEEAIDFFEKSIEIDSDNLSNWVLKGVSLANINKHIEAIKCFNQAINLEPKDAGVWYYKGRSQIFLGLKNDAIKSFDMLVRLDPDNPESYYYKGMSLLDVNEHGEAEGCFDKALKLKPDYEMAWLKKGKCIGLLKGPENALKCFEEAIKLNDDNPESWYMKGVVLRQLERFTESLSSFREVLELDPQNLGSWHQIGRVYQNMGDYYKSIDAFDHVLNVNQTIIPALLEKGRSLGMSGRDKEALECFEKILETEPNNSGVLKLKKLANKLLNKKFTVKIYVSNQVIKISGIKGRENAIAVGKNSKKEMNGDKFELIEEKEELKNRGERFNTRKDDKKSVEREKNSKNTKVNTNKCVQSCITNVSFPKTIEDLSNMIYKHKNHPFYIKTDMNILLNLEGYVKPYDWTAPKWLTEGDILFFYHAKSAKQRTKKLYKEYKSTKNPDKLILDTLKQSIRLAEKYSGTIFGCTQITGTPKYYPDEEKIWHFKGRIFAPFEDFTLFEYPLASEKFTEYVKISRQGTITPISNKEEFEGLKNLLKIENTLPSFLLNAELTDIGFRGINQDNWSSLSCSKNTKFIHESQIRTYLIDFFLKEIKDSQTPLLEECQCYRRNKSTGYSDYFIKLNAKWISIEAKVNILAEKNIESQISKYLKIDYFKPTKGYNKGKEYEYDNSNICIVIDQSGLYIFKNKKFLDCEPGQPYYKRESLLKTKSIKNEISKLV